jgi:hypothetical protein
VGAQIGEDRIDLLDQRVARFGRHMLGTTAVAEPLPDRRALRIEEPRDEQGLGSPHVAEDRFRVGALNAHLLLQGEDLALSPLGVGGGLADLFADLGDARQDHLRRLLLLRLAERLGPDGRHPRQLVEILLQRAAARLQHDAPLVDLATARAPRRLQFLQVLSRRLAGQDVARPRFLALQGGLRLSQRLLDFADRSDRQQILPQGAQSPAAADGGRGDVRERYRRRLDHRGSRQCGRLAGRRRILRPRRGDRQQRGDGNGQRADRPPQPPTVRPLAHRNTLPVAARRGNESAEPGAVQIRTAPAISFQRSAFGWARTRRKIEAES